MKRRKNLRKTVKNCPDCYISKMKGVERICEDGSLLTASGQVVCEKHHKGQTDLTILTFRHNK